MTADRGSVTMPDPYVLSFEGRTVEYHEHCRDRRCSWCAHWQSIVYGQNMPGDVHLCYRESVKHIVVWKAL